MNQPPGQGGRGGDGGPPGWPQNQQAPHGQPQQQAPYGQPPTPQGNAFGGVAPQPRPFGAPGAPAPAVPVGRATHRRPKSSGSARLTGLALVGIGMFLLLLNGYTLWENEEFYPKALLFAPMALLLGAWLTVVGQPIDKQTGEPVLWSKVGGGLFAGFGLVLGIIAIWFVGC